MSIKLVDDGNTIEVQGDDINLIESGHKLKLDDQGRETVLVDGTSDSLKLQDSEESLNIEEPRELVKAWFGPVGPRGPRGLSGASGGAEVIREAGETMGAMRVVVATTDDIVMLADVNSPDHFGRVVGITTQAVNAGESVKIQRFDLVTNSGLTFTSGAWLYIGSGGILTETPVLGDWWQIVGYAVSSTAFEIALREPIILTEV